jgi:hypothetical protein
MRTEIKSFIYKLLHQARQEGIEEAIELLEKGTRKDYEVLGMGSLDYHEKYAIDGYIEWLRLNLKKLISELKKKGKK